MLFLLFFSIKTPVFPFSIWLPEAHVEAAFPGSISLAVFGLKFSLFSIFIFTNSIADSSLETLIFLFISLLIATISIASTSDIKKIVANLSILHMSAAVITFFNSFSQSLWSFSNFTWHHHSIVTGALFLLIGAIYSILSSRLVRFGFPSYAISAITTTAAFTLLSLSFDFPWTANSLCETLIFRSADLLISPVLALTFCISFIGFAVTLLKIMSSRNFKAIVIFDLRAQITVICAISTILSFLGFFIL